MFTPQRGVSTPPTALNPFRDSAVKLVAGKSPAVLKCYEHNTLPGYILYTGPFLHLSGWY